MAAGPGGAGTVQQRRPCGSYAIPCRLDRAGREESESICAGSRPPHTAVHCKELMRKGAAIRDGRLFSARQLLISPRAASAIGVLLLLIGAISTTALLIFLISLPAALVALLALDLILTLRHRYLLYRSGGTFHLFRRTNLSLHRGMGPPGTGDATLGGSSPVHPIQSVGSALVP